MPLRRFLNLTDIKRAARNPRKAIRVLSRSVFKRKTTNITDTSEYDDQIIRLLSEVLSVDSKTIDRLLTQARSGDCSTRLNECQDSISNQPYTLGGANLAGELSYVISRLLKPNSVLEIGVANGVSTLYLLAAAQVEEYSVDIRGIDKPQFVSDVVERRGRRGLQGVGGVIPDSREAAWVAPRELRQKYAYQYYVGDFTQILPDIVGDMASLDIVLYDATKDSTEMQFAYETILNELAPNGVLISDDIDVNNAFEATCEDYRGRMVKIGGCGFYFKGDW